jgi:hypothetical protein
MLYTRCNMQASQRLATVIGSTAFEDLQRGVHFADEELLLVPDEMPIGAVGEFVDDDMVVGKTQWLVKRGRVVKRRLYTFPGIYEPVSESEAVRAEFAGALARSPRGTLR